VNTHDRLQRHLNEILAASRLDGSTALEVRRELSRHLFDLHADIVHDGWGEPAAGDRAIAEFGEADELGRLIGQAKRSRRAVRFGSVARWAAIAAALALAAGIGLRAGEGLGSGDPVGASESQPQLVAAVRAVEPEPKPEPILAASAPVRPVVEPEPDADNIDPASPDSPAAQTEVALVRERAETLDAGDRKPFELRLRLLFLLIRLRLEGRP